jgi:hypothetical protein
VVVGRMQVGVERFRLITFLLPFFFGLAANVVDEIIFCTPIKFARSPHLISDWQKFIPT